jgi:membrane-bound serine protease (ClpP class)
VTILLAQASEEAANTLLWAFLLVGATIFLISLELIVPSGGILAICAAASLIGSVAAFFMHDTTTGFVALAAIAVLGPLAGWIGWKWWSGTSMAERLILQTTADAVTPAHSDLLHRTGIAETDLRPIGVVRIDDDRHDALSDLGVIPAGTRIIVIRVLDNQLKVRTAEADDREKTS